LRQELQKQINGWHENMREKYNRQSENLSAALDYLIEERDFDFGPDPSRKFRSVNISIDNGIRINYISLDNKNWMEFLKNSNEVRMKYLQEKWWGMKRYLFAIWCITWRYKKRWKSVRGGMCDACRFLICCIMRELQWRNYKKFALWRMNIYVRKCRAYCMNR